MNFTTPYNNEDFFFTKEDDLILFNSPLENTYFEMVVNITAYDFYTNKAVPTTLSYKIPLFNNRASFLLGEIIDRSMPRIKTFDLRSLYQYKAAEVTLEISEYDISTSTILSTDVIKTIKFVTGYKPQTVENNCAFLEIYNLPRSVSATGYGFINMILPLGKHRFKILKNKIEVSNFEIDIISGNIISRGLKMADYQAKQGDIIECIMPDNPKLNKSFYILPYGLFTNYIAFEDEYNLKTIIEFTGEYSFPIDFETKTNKVQYLSVFNNQKISSDKIPTLTINTGYLLEEEEVMIESLLDSSRAWLIVGENKAIELVPNSKKFLTMSASREYYEFGIEFMINLQNKKPLRLSLNQPLIILEVDDIAPSIPTNLQVVNLNTTTVVLQWEKATDISGIAGYDLYINGVYRVSSTQNLFDVNGLTPNTTYQMYIKARDLSGNISENSNAISVQTLAEQDKVPPSTPGNLRASSITSSTVRLDWTVSTDNVKVSKYNIYRDGLKIISVAGNSTTIGGLSPNTTYNFYIVAEDLSGNLSEASTTLSVKTALNLVKGFEMSSSGHSSEQTACALNRYSAFRYHDGSYYYPIVGNTIYSDSEGSVKFIGFNRKYSMGNNGWVLINDYGVVTLAGSCNFNDQANA